MAKIKKVKEELEQGVELPTEFKQDVVVDKLPEIELPEIVEPKAVLIKDSTPLVELSLEEKIKVFIDSREDGDIVMNDFLKSLYGVQKYNEPPKWASQPCSKELRGVLVKMQNEGSINIQGHTHLRLGQFYYKGDSPITQYNNLNTVVLVAKKSG